MQPTSVFSLGSDLWSPSISSQLPTIPPGEQTSLSGWWVLVDTDFCVGISSLCPLHPCCCPLLHGWKASPQPIPYLCQWRGFLVCGNFSSFTAPSQRCRSHPYSFVFFSPFLFCPTQAHGEFLAFWEVWGLLPAFSRCSVGVVPRVDVFLMFCGKEGDLHVLLLHHLEGSRYSFSLIFKIVFLFSILFISALIFIIPFLLLALGFVSFYFPSSLSCKVGLLVCELSCFLNVFIGISFPLSTAFTTSHLLVCCVVIFIFIFLYIFCSSPYDFFYGILVV